MPLFIAYDSHGMIVRKGFCSETDLPNQALDGLSVLDVTGSTVFDGTFTGCYVDSSGAVQKRTAIPYACPASASVGAAVALTAPAGAAVTVDGASVGTIDSTGADSLTFSDAGTYAVSLSLWPYLDADFQVEVA